MDGGDGSSSGLAKPWYETGIGLAVVGANVLLTIVLVLLTTDLFVFGSTEVAGAEVGVVPWYIYVFSVLGALGYVFTALTDDFHCPTAKVLQFNFRVPAALPLGAGVFLLSDVVLADASGVESVVAGLAFLAGLYVNLAYRRLGALAERLLPDRGDGRGDAGADDDGDAPEDDGDAAEDDGDAADDGTERRPKGGTERSIEFDERGDGAAATEDADEGTDGPAGERTGERPAE